MLAYRIQITLRRGRQLIARKTIVYRLAARTTTWVYGNIQEDPTPVEPS